MKEQKEKRKKGDEFKFSDFDEQEEIRRQNAWYVCRPIAYSSLI